MWIGVCSKLEKAKTGLFMHIKGKRILIILRVFWIKKTIPLALVGYEMIVANSYPKHIC